jgi:phospholipase C
MDSPNPDPGEEYQHTNTQLFNVLDEANRFKDATEMVAPVQRPGRRAGPHHGRLRHRLHQLLHRRDGPQPTYDEYSRS